MPADKSQPLRGQIMLRPRTGEIIAGFGGAGPGLLDGALAAQDDQGSGEGEVGGEGFDGKGMQLPAFDPPVAGLGLGKKGVSFKASNP